MFDGIDRMHVAKEYSEAESCAEDIGGEIVPLYRSPRWIPVSERLPEGSCRVLAWDGTRVSEVHFHPRAKQSEQWYSFAGHESPTHWMPLPEPPEVK